MNRSKYAWFLTIAGLFLPPTGTSRSDEPASGEQLVIVVRERAGIRRFGYPVRALVSLPGRLAEARQWRLLDNGKPIAAQFLRRNGRQVDLDFNVSLGPYETREYLVQGGDFADRSRRQGGIQIENEKATWRVCHGNELEFLVPTNLLGLLRQVRTPQTDYLRAGSAGLLIRYKDNIHFRAGGSGPHGSPTVTSVSKPGPLCGSLRFEGTEALRGGRSVPSCVEMDFPVSKSWVEVRWTVDDPHGYVAGLGADLNLNVQGEPTLVDFGAGSLVYAQLRKGEAAKMRAGSLSRNGSPGLAASWEILTGRTGALTPYVAAPRGAQAPPAEGWAHIMDRERCTAVAVADFACPGQEAEITIDADGRLQIWKCFAWGGAAAPPGPKKLTFWLHFVGMPVHVGAATSPQAMLAPLAVESRRK